MKNMNLQNINTKTINLLELIAFANRGQLAHWEQTIRLAIRALAKEELQKYDQAMDALRKISFDADECSTELCASKLRDKMRSFVKISDSVLSSEEKMLTTENS